MKKVDDKDTQNGEVIVKIPYGLCYRRYGKNVEKTILIRYGIPRAIAQEFNVESLQISREMAAVIYEAEREMETARKRVSELKIGCYVEGLSEIEMDYQRDEVYEQVERKFVSDEIGRALNELRPLQR